MISASATLDTGSFLGGLKSLDQGVLSFVGGLKSITGFLPGIGALIGLFGALKGAIDMGGELTDLSAQTGESVANLAVLQQAFKNAGISAGDVRPVLQKLQANLADASDGTGKASHALQKLGLDANALRTMSSVEQLEAMQRALTGVEDQADKAQIARDLLGDKKGGKVLSFLSDEEGISSAKAQLGALPQVMEKMSPILDKVGDAVGSLGLKFTQLAGGALESMGPALEQFLTQLSEVDLTGIGEGLGLLVSLGLQMLEVFKPVLAIIQAISAAMHGAFQDAFPASPVPKKKGGGEDDAGLLGGLENAPVSNLAAVGGSFRGGFSVDLGSKVDVTNEHLSALRSLAERTPRPSKPEVPV